MLINEEIREKEVRVVDADGSQLGIMPTRQALALAADKGLDLVDIAPQATPNVCRIMDFGKYRYEQAKREKMCIRDRSKSLPMSSLVSYLKVVLLSLIHILGSPLVKICGFRDGGRRPSVPMPW